MTDVVRARVPYYRDGMEPVIRVEDHRPPPDTVHVHSNQRNHECSCCGGDDAVRDVVIGWTTDKHSRQRNHAVLSGQTRSAMCGPCRRRLSAALEEP